MHIDPIFIIASAIAIAVLLASAATHKVRAPARFARQLADYQLLPQALVRPSARLVPVVELGIAFALLGEQQHRLAAAVLAAVIPVPAAAEHLQHAQRDGGRREVNLVAVGDRMDDTRDRAAQGVELADQAGTVILQIRDGASEAVDAVSMFANERVPG